MEETTAETSAPLRASAPEQTEAAPAAGPLVVQEESVEEWLREHAFLWNGTAEQIAALTRLVYGGTDQPILTFDDRDTLLEVAGMLVSGAESGDPVWFQRLVAFLAASSDAEDLYWNQPAADAGKKAVEREIRVFASPMSGAKGVTKCKYCGSTEAHYSERQTRSGDEPMTVFYHCASCNRKWKE